MIGFHHARPSMYLSRVIDRIDDEACLGWKPQTETLYQELARTIRFPEPLFPQTFRGQALLIPTLHFLTVTEVSRRFERPQDFLNFNPRLETIVFGRRVHLHLHHDLYPILGYMAELILLRMIDASLFKKNIEWIYQQKIVFARDERFLCWVHDFDLHHMIGTDMYASRLQQMFHTHQTVLQNDPALMDLVHRLEREPAYVLPQCFSTIPFHDLNRLVIDNQYTDFTSWWNLALIFREIKDRHRRPYLYRYINMDISLIQRKQMTLLTENIQALALRFSKDIVFHPSHDLRAHVKDSKMLEDLGFDRDMDEVYFTNGYHYGLVGESDVIDYGNHTLYEIKASHLDLSMEWILQTSVYGFLSFRYPHLKNLMIANVITGRIHRWERPHLRPRTIIDRIFISFPEHLKEHLHKSNYRRFKRLHDVKN
jgi:hypothetical protein